jgi:hypothetical protein
MTENIEGPYSIEPHGKEGNHVLYYQRDNKHHGMNLLTLSDGDLHMEIYLKLIEDALNYYYANHKSA